MTEHACRTFDPACFRCDLSRDEIESERIDHERVAKLLRGVARHPKRRPGTRGLLLDLADELANKAREMRTPGDYWDCADNGGDSCSLSNPCPAHVTGPYLATADDVIEGRARYADTPGGHADRKTLAKEASQASINVADGVIDYAISIGLPFDRPTPGAPRRCMADHYFDDRTGERRYVRCDLPQGHADSHEGRSQAGIPIGSLIWPVTWTTNPNGDAR